jgi:hypothetical protein
MGGPRACEGRRFRINGLELSLCFRKGFGWAAEEGPGMESIFFVLISCIERNAGAVYPIGDDRLRFLRGAMISCWVSWVSTRKEL